MYFVLCVCILYTTWSEGGCVVPVVRLGLRSSTKAKEKEMGVVRKDTESASSLWLLSVACCSIIKHSHDSNRAISCERGVAIVANCAYPLRYLASRFSARCHAGYEP